MIEQADKINNFDSFMAFLDFTSYSLEDEDLGYLLSKFNDCFIGKYDREEDYAEQYISDCYDLSDFMQTYFDYEKFANYLFVTDYYYDDDTNSVFSRNY